MLPSTTLIAVVLAAAPVKGPEPIRLAAPGWSVVEVDQKKVDFFEDFFAQQLIAEGAFRVTSRAELGAVIGLERQKAMLGCSSEATSCFAELASALGVDGLITGSIAKTKSGFAMNVKIIGAQDARQLAAFTARVKDEDEVLDFLTASAKKVAATIPAALGKAPGAPLAAGPSVGAAPLVPVAAASPGAEGSATPGTAEAGVSSAAPASPLRRFAWVPVAVGGVAAVGGGVLFYLSTRDAARLRSHDPSLTSAAEVAALQKHGESFQTGGVALLGVGGAALAAGVGMFLLGAPSSAPRVSVLVLPGAALLGVEGVLP